MRQLLFIPSLFLFACAPSNAPAHDAGTAETPQISDAIQAEATSPPVAATVSNVLPQFGTTIVTELDADGDVIRVSHEGRGDGGEIRVVAENVTLEDGAKLSSTGLFGGDGGHVFDCGFFAAFDYGVADLRVMSWSPRGSVMARPGSAFCW